MYSVMVLIKREGSEGQGWTEHVQYEAGEDLADFGEGMSGQDGAR